MTRTPQRRIEFTVSYELGDAYDEARGDTPMATWIKAVLFDHMNAVPLSPGSAPHHTPHSRDEAMARQAKLNAAKAGKR